ncbi:protein artichoke [Daktulosphaira vitifoliae]|uniref:protein artichoke n=1 Tax=Daktulosphaira vitifoliae TaxID=58002 RepID=UPI0021AA1861|nr:protein artichoke [Daktulosphaira vitifoliae]XP_050539407.1 protein artichoke [Daktulosphaira vitifoliae]
MRTRWKDIFLALMIISINSSHAATMSCEDFQNEFRYPCTCEEFRPIGGLAINCDGVVFSGDNFVVPKDAPILVFTQKNAGHHSIPSQLFPSSVKIDLSQNSIRRLPEKSFIEVKNSLEDLRLANNLLGDNLNPIFSTTEFHELSKLIRLDLSENRISSLEEGILKGCIRLEELKLNGNRLEFVPSSSLNGPQSLRTLSLKNNRIERVHHGSFLSQKTLLIIDLSSNRVNNIEIGAFEGLSSIKQILLSENRLTKFNSDVFQGAEKLEKLDVSNNFIAEFPTVSLKRFDHLKILNLSSNLLQKLDNSHLTTTLEVLDVSRNNIGIISPGTFMSLKKLKVLNLSVNMLRNIEDDAFDGLANLESLSLEDNNILLIPVTALNKLPRLSKLRLDYNRIAALSSSILRGMADMLTELGLSRNVIRELPSDVFQDFKKLKVLDLGGNLLLSIEPTMFSGLENTLEFLNLQGNRIATISPDPINLQSLKSLDLSFNQLKEIPRHTFMMMSSLLNLNLSHNPHLGLIPVSVFHPLSQLQKLDLSFTNIKILSPELFFKTNSLTHLNIRCNGITEIPETMFQTLSNLIWLDVSENQIANIRIGSFAGLSSIKYINLSKNKLSSFKGEYFITKRSSGTSLEEIDMSNNQISYLFPSTFKVHPSIKSIRLSNNKFNYFPSELISGLAYLQEIDLSKNSLKALEEFDFAGLPNFRELNLAENQIDTISETTFHNSTQLQTINLANNNLERIGERTFQGLNRLHYLSLENNNLTELPDLIFDRSRLKVLENINLSKNKFTTAPLKSLQKQYFFLSSVDLSSNKLIDLQTDDSILVNIKKLDLSFNPLSESAVKNILSEPKTVRELNVAGTGIRSLLALETPFLQKLNLSFNSIDDVDEHMFDRATLIEELDLSHNELQSLASLKAVWPKLKNIQSVDLSWNPITSIVLGDIDGLSSLRSLRISNLFECNKIEKNAFKNLGNLVELKMFDLPKLGYLDVTGLLNNLHSLEILDIEVKDSSIGTQLSAAMNPRLKSLAIQGQMINTISSGALAGLKSQIVQIKIHNTSLTNLPPSLLIPLPRSSEVQLDVSSNQLTTLSSQFLSALDDRRSLLKFHGLKSNPIYCDCNVRALRRSPLAIDLVCSAPAFVAGSILIEIPDDDLTCDISRQTTTTMATSTLLMTSTTNNPVTIVKAPKVPMRTTTEPDIIWSLPPATTSNQKPPLTMKSPNLASVTTIANDDTLIIGIVAGVVVFIAILIIIICIVRIRLSAAEYNSHMNALPPVLGASLHCTNPSCPCPKIAGQMYPMSAASYSNSYATLPTHKLSSVSSPLRQSYNNLAGPPYTHNPYYIPYTTDEKEYAMSMR